MFIHCVLAVSDIYRDTALTPAQLLTQNVEIYIGNDPDYTMNQKCAGGPFMVVGDTNWYTTGSTGNNSGNEWNYGLEVWCNLEGQYVTIVSDMSQYSGQVY